MLRINAEHSPRGVNEDVYLDEDGSDEAADDEGKGEEDADVGIEGIVEGDPASLSIFHPLTLFFTHSSLGFRAGTFNNFPLGIQC